MATQHEIIALQNTRWAFDEALRKALLADPAMVKELGLPGFTTNCKIEVAFAVKAASDWHEDSTVAEIIFSLTGVVSGRVIDAEGSVKLRGLKADWATLPPDYSVGMPRFENMKVRAKVVV